MPDGFRIPPLPGLSTKLSLPRQPHQSVKLCRRDLARRAAVCVAPAAIVTTLHYQPVSAAVVEREVVWRRRAAVRDPRPIGSRTDVSPNVHDRRLLAQANDPPEKQSVVATRVRRAVADHFGECDGVGGSPAQRVRGRRNRKKRADENKDHQAGHADDARAVNRPAQRANGVLPRGIQQ
jgi:hypothetical protein